MKKVLSAAVAAAVVLAGGACFAQGSEPGPLYVKVLGKYTSLSDPEVNQRNTLKLESDNGWGIGAAVGMHFNQFRVEAELAYQDNDIDSLTFNPGTGPAIGLPSGDTKITSYMVNGYFDWPLNGGFGLYVMGGLGMATTDISIQSLDDNDTTFAFKAGAGVFYAINPNMLVDFGYEYLNVDDADIGNVEVTDIYCNSLVAAFRYRF